MDREITRMKRENADLRILVLRLGAALEAQGYGDPHAGRHGDALVLDPLYLTVKEGP